MNFLSLIEMDIDISGIPVTKIEPISKKPDRAIIFYHGYSSSVKRTLFRGRILASMGYEVLIPEAMGHGIRANEKDLDFSRLDPNMCDVIVSNITESSNLINYLCEKEGISPKNLTVMGHSMGAMTAAGIFVKIPFGNLVMFNGSLDFLKMLDYDGKKHFKDDETYFKLKNVMKYYSPAEFLSKLENRPIIMIDGAQDKVVPPAYNRRIYEILKPFYKDKSMIEHHILPNSGHKMTVEAMELAVNFLDKEVL